MERGGGRGERNWEGGKTGTCVSAPTPKCGQGTDIFKPAGNMGADQERQDCARGGQVQRIVGECLRLVQRERGRGRENRRENRREGGRGREGGREGGEIP